MKVKNIDFPDELIDRLEDNKLVIFAGAGVSEGKPSNLPTFRKLTEKIAKYAGRTLGDHDSEDTFLGFLHDEGVKVHKISVDLLSPDNSQPNELHKNLLRLYTASEKVRIVTTNYDNLFEKAAQNVFNGKKIEVHVAPALPSGQDFRGIIHLHGSANNHASMVLTDSDFGDAYLIDERRAYHFLKNMLRCFNVLFVGYSHNDIVINYLMRAMPDKPKSYFVLTHKTEKNIKEWRRWQMLRIFPISYPESENHAALYADIQRLADIMNWRLLDWRKQVEKIVKNPPSSDKSQMDIIKRALENETKIKFFTSAALSPKWIDWLDENKYLDALFRHGDYTLNDRDWELVKWLVRFVHHDSKQLFSLIGRHHTFLHPYFLYELAKKVGNIAPEPSNQKVISQWVSLLLTTTPLNIVISQYVLSCISKPCIKQNMVEELLQIFGAMSKSVFGTDREHFHRLPFVGTSSSLNEVWQKGLKPKLEQAAEPLLMLAAKRLRERYSMRQIWSATSYIYDTDNIGRSEIRFQEQDSNQEMFQKEIDVLIDAARDSLEWLVINKVDAANYWSNYLSAEEAPLLRRLAVHGISKSQKLTSNEKIDWLLEHVGLHDYPFNNNKEIAKMIKRVYLESDEQHRGRLIRSALDFSMLNGDENSNKKKRVAFGWFSLFLQAASDCMLVKREIDKLLKQHPELREQSHDFLEQHRPRLPTVHDVKLESPWSTEELLSKPPADWLQELLSFEPSDAPFDPNQEGLIKNITEAAKQNFSWGIGLAQALSDKLEWKSDSWHGLITSWSEVEPDQNRYQQIIDYLSKTDLHPHHLFVIAQTLRNMAERLAKNSNKPCSPELLSSLNKIAENLWVQIDRGRPLGLSNSYNWLGSAINHPAGTLAMFWIYSFSIWRQQQNHMPKPAISDDYRRMFSLVIRDNTIAGILGRSFFCSQFHFLLDADKEWTKENLLSLFSEENPEEFQAAWDGFLTWGILDPNVAQLLGRPFLKAAQKIEPRCQDEFIKYCINMLYFDVGIPKKEWIQNIIQSMGNAKHAIAYYLGHILSELSEDNQKKWWQSWLKEYWEDRLDGVPCPFENNSCNEAQSGAPGEVELMLDWLPHLTAVFSEAVGLAIRMKPTCIVSSLLIHNLNQSHLPQRYPEDVAKLLDYLGDLEMPDYLWGSTGLSDPAKKLIDKVIQAGLPQEWEQKMRELIVKKQLKDAPNNSIQG